MFAFVLRHDVGGHSISGSHSISKQNDRGSEYFEIERPGGQKLGGSFDFVTPACAVCVCAAVSALGHVYQWVISIVQQCESDVGNPRARCYRQMDVSKDNCRSVAGAPRLVMQQPVADPEMTGLNTLPPAYMQTGSI